MTPGFLRPELRPETRSDLPAIPRLIWQTSSPGRLADPRVAAAIESLRLTNPGWTHHCLDDDAVAQFLDRVGSDRLHAALRRLSPDFPQARIDIYRYLQLYLTGGVYFDDKSGATQPLDRIIEPQDRFLIAQGAASTPPGPIEALRSRIAHVEGGEFVNWFIASAPGHPFLAAVLEAALDRIDSYAPLFSGTGKRAVLGLTGPFLYTRTLAPLRDRHPHRMVVDDRVGLKYSVLPPAMAHEDLRPDHYSRRYSPPVTAQGLGPVRRLRFRLEWLLVSPFAALRRLNGERLRRRRARRRARETMPDTPPRGT